ncbi:hypothetical protein NC652_008176 [Populus alba x Populus x berolinensis]|nr:hypothetical protein NC652_008176 [Populus alba x Populus x berolinensis]
MPRLWLILMIVFLRMHCYRNFSMIITCQRKKGVFFVGERMLVQLKQEQKYVLG